jgi:hypothetical protein
VESYEDAEGMRITKSSEEPKEKATNFRAVIPKVEKRKTAR